MIILQFGKKAKSFYKPKVHSPLELVLIFGFCSVDKLRVIDSPWTGH